MAASGMWPAARAPPTSVWIRIRHCQWQFEFKFELPEIRIRIRSGNSNSNSPCKAGTRGVCACLGGALRQTRTEEEIQVRSGQVRSA